MVVVRMENLGNKATRVETRLGFCTSGILKHPYSPNLTHRQVCVDLRQHR